MPFDVARGRTIDANADVNIDVDGNRRIGKTLVIKIGVPSR